MRTQRAGWPAVALFRIVRWMVSFDGVVIVTGAGGGGCGRAIAARFARGGASVVVSDINDPGGEETVRLIQRDRGRAAFFHADVRDERQVRDLIAFGDQQGGGTMVLVNNASAPFRPGEPLEHWMDTVQTDLIGPLHATRHAIDAMRRRGGGAIVNIASISALWHGRRHGGGAPGYDTAKAGLIRLTTTLEWLAKRDRIRVNCLAPGWIATDGPRQYWESMTPAQRAERGAPATLLSVDQVASAVVHLATDETLAGRVLAWWSDDPPRFIAGGDRGYEVTDESASARFRALNA
jgi:NAD(P)-dependent dehydrogenase (short-subunit alcohol dehydrogenase family)